MKIYFVQRSINLNDQIDNAFTNEPDCILIIGESPLSQNDKIPIRKENLGLSTGINNEIRCIFDVASLIPDSSTGNLDIFVYRI